ncbi:putative N-formylglutamate amidohydrolase [Breoghania corrubedonensis]|uniref:Putative N-formylglutamate amidohydrolase n=1 Tax=Breoghania corrubedonensis TaxID=665038 RepID=A0A2T5VC72_9HYPH|nr:N-formylglutamate amidohydrolase [Breoghania corrubedonensis]PTW61347.1 putative N-formylglutamate amidohydrolase [Breoghania corrubedonensis]
MTDGLLRDGDCAPFAMENPGSTSPIFLTSDHAGRAIPKRLGSLGLSQEDRGKHVAYDIGIYGVTTRIAQALKATYIYQPYSRLVIDCNRLPGNAQSVAPVSDGVRVPGNVDLAQADIEARQNEILMPYQDAIARTLDEREAAALPTLFFAMHSCTPVMGSMPPRPWHIGVMAVDDWRIGDELIALLEKETDFCIGRNQPYEINPATDYTVPVHAIARRLPYVEIEIRQDLIGEENGQREWAALLSDIFPRAIANSEILAH